MTSAMSSLAAVPASSQLVYDLGQTLEHDIPVWPGHPAYQHALDRRHGDVVRVDGVSSASDLITLGGHVGTHIDALCHFSCEGLLHGGRPAAEVQGQFGFAELAVETIPPLIRRGVLLDVPGALGVDLLEPAYEISVDDVERCVDAHGFEVRPGDVVVVRTGWGRFWTNGRERMRGAEGGVPGPGLAAASLLADDGAVAMGSDTLAFEVVVPGQPTLPVHRHLLVERGIYIIEGLVLEALAADGVREFTFVGVPLKLVGATGSPLRPLGVVENVT